MATQAAKRLESELFTITPLSPVMGAEVVGLDVARPLEAGTRARIWEAI